MRFIKGLAVLFLSCLATCVVTERSFPLPQIAETDKGTDLCLGEMFLFTDSKFEDPLGKDHFMAKKAEAAKQEARVTLCEKLKEQGFSVCSDHSEGSSGVHLDVDLGLRTNFFRFFIVARVRGFSEKDNRELFEFLAEVEVLSGEEDEVRRAGKELAEKVARGLKEVLAAKPQ